MSSKDAYLFPVLGSCVLFSIYLLFKFLSKEWINFLMSIYFMFLGVGAIAAVLSPIIKSIVPYEITKRKPYSIQFSLPSFIRKEPIKIELHIVEIISIFIGCIIGAIYITTKHWVTNNIIGECFAITGIELVSLGSFKIACTLLVGSHLWLFLTDYF
jgi:minor histocompatibility antigen H13